MEAAIPVKRPWFSCCSTICELIPDCKLHCCAAVLHALCIGGFAAGLYYGITEVWGPAITFEVFVIMGHACGVCGSSASGENSSSLSDSAVSKTREAATGFFPPSNVAQSIYNS